MTETLSNQSAFLRTSRNFPYTDVKQLATEVNKSYVNIASVVNACVRGLFPTTSPAVTGEEWFLVGNNKQQTLRQVYTITSTSALNHGLNIQDINQFTRCWGQYTDSTGTNSYGLVWGTSTATAGLITFYITSTQVNFVVGAGAPALAKGKIILEWLSQP